MKTRVTVQNQDALHEKYDYPTEHSEAMNDDQGENLVGDFASPKPFPMRKKQAKTDDGRNQHYASRDHIEKPFGR